MYEQLQLKADGAEMKEQLSRINSELSQHADDIETKADEVETLDRHQSLAIETATSFKTLGDGHERLGISINSVQEQVGQMASIMSTKAERHEVTGQPAPQSQSKPQSQPQPQPLPLP